MEQTKEKKEMKIGLSTIIIIITLIIIVVMSYYIYKVSEAKKVSDQKVEKLSEQVDELENTINAISTTISQSQTTKEVSKKEEGKKEITQKQLISDIEYMEVMIEDMESIEGLSYKETRKITNVDMIEEFMKKVNTAELYENFEDDFGASGFTELPPMVYAYDKTGNRTGIMGTTLEGVNIMMLWAKDDESDKKIYKLDSNLGEYIEQMYKK